MPGFDVQERIVEELFAASSHYSVPPFQRPFAWGKDEISQLVEDLFGGEVRPSEPYFLGTIVAVDSRRVASDPTYSLIDGQQRLTSLSLLIAVLGELCQVYEELSRERKDRVRLRVSTCLFTDGFDQVDDVPRPRLRLQRDDALIYDKLIRNTQVANDPDLKDAALCVAVRALRTEVQRQIAENSQLTSRSTPALDLLNFLLKSVELVRIIVPSERDAFRLFEALNDRGLSLSAADLVKNRLFGQCESEIESAIESWKDVMSVSETDDLVAFLRTYWICCHEFKRKAELYDAYRVRIDEMGSQEALAFVQALAEAAGKYELIANPPSTADVEANALYTVFARLNGYGARSCRPALLAASLYHPNNIRLQIQIARLCESVTVRYSIVGGKNPNRLEKLYAAIAKSLRSATFRYEDLQTLSEMQDVPGDEEFEGLFAQVNVGKGSKSWFHVLAVINEVLAEGSGEAALGGRSVVHIEHILPQRPSSDALAEFGTSEPQKIKELTGLVGNLTLLSGPRNRRASNRPFSAKKDLYIHSDVFMTREVARNRRWTERKVLERSQLLAARAVEAFPL